MGNESGSMACGCREDEEYFLGNGFGQTGWKDEAAEEHRRRVALRDRRARKRARALLNGKSYMGNGDDHSSRNGGVGRESSTNQLYAKDRRRARSSVRDFEQTHRGTGTLPASSHRITQAPQLVGSSQGSSQNEIFERHLIGVAAEAAAERRRDDTHSAEAALKEARVQRAATLIEARERGKRARSEYKREKGAAVIIEARERGKLVRGEYKRQKDAALEIEAIFRSHNSRSHIKENKKRKEQGLCSLEEEHVQWENKKKQVKLLYSNFACEVKVLRAQNLLPMDTSGNSDPYVVVKCHKEKFRTPTISKTLNPNWEGKKGASHTFKFTSWEKLKSAEFHIRTFDHDTFGNHPRQQTQQTSFFKAFDDLIGETLIPNTEILNRFVVALLAEPVGDMNSVVKGAPSTFELHLTSARGKIMKKGGGYESAGHVFLQITPNAVTQVDTA